MSLDPIPRDINTGPLWGRAKEEEGAFYQLLGNEGGSIRSLSIDHVQICYPGGGTEVDQTIVSFPGLRFLTDFTFNNGSYQGGSSLDTTRMKIVFNLFAELHKRLQIAKHTRSFWLRLDGTYKQLMYVSPQEDEVITIKANLENIFPHISQALGIPEHVKLDRYLNITRGPDHLAHSLYQYFNYPPEEITSILSNQDLTSTVDMIAKDLLGRDIGRMAALRAPIPNELRHRAAQILATQNRIWNLAGDMVYVAPKHGDLHWIQVPNWPVPREV